MALDSIVPYFQKCLFHRFCTTFNQQEKYSLENFTKSKGGLIKIRIQYGIKYLSISTYVCIY